MNNSSGKLYLYPVWVRIWHLVNGLLCIILIVTGLSIQFSNPTIAVQFKVAVSIHNIAGILLALSYIFFFSGNLFTRNGAYYIISVKGFISRIFAQLRYYIIGIFKNEQPPFPVNIENKFNPLQQFSYVVVMYFLIPIMILSGLGLLYPEILVTRLMGASGLDLADLLHIIAGFCVTLFLCIHLYICTIGKTPTSTFKSMVNGYHEPH